MNRTVIYVGAALLFIPVVVNAGIPYAPQEKGKNGNAKQEYIGVRSNEPPKVLHALAESQKLKIGEVKRYYIPEYATKKTDVVVGEGNRIGRNVAAETIFADDDGKVREAQNADATIRDAYGNRIIYDDQGNLVGKITPDGWLFVRSTEWERIKKLDFLSDDADQVNKKSKKKSTESDRVGGSTPSITMKDVIRALGPDDESQADKKGK